MPGIHFGLEGLLPWVLYGGMWLAFGLSVFWRPTTGLYLLVLTLPMQTGRYKIHDLPLGSQFLDILLLGTIIGLWLKRQEVIPKSPINRLLVIIAVYSYLSLWEGAFFINAPLPLWISDSRVSDWKNYVEMFLFAPVVAAAFKEKKEIKWLLLCIGFSMLVVNRSYYNLMSGRDLTHFNYDVRDDGPVGYAGVNGLAALEAMVLAFLLGVYTYVRTFWQRCAILVLAATSVYCLLFSFSRGGYLGILTAMLVLGLLKNRKLLLVLAAVALSWQLILPTSVQERITMTTGEAAGGAVLESSAQERVDLWEDAYELFKQSPVTGTGFHTYEFLGRIGTYRDTHNYYIKTAVETGVIGLLLFFALLRRLAMMGWRLFRTSDEPFWSGIGLGFLALVCSAVVMNFFGDRWTYQQIDGVLWVLLGCVIRGQAAIDAKFAAAAAGVALPVAGDVKRAGQVQGGGCKVGA